MVLEFLFPFRCFNLSFLNFEKTQEVIKKIVLTYIKAVKNFKYGKNNDKYQDKAKLYQQVLNKALPITETFYPGYLLLFFFNNATNHFIYTKNVLQVKNINKNVGS